MADDQVEVDGPVFVDVGLERGRQIIEKGYTPQHDDEHSGGALALAGAAYVVNAAHILEAMASPDWIDAMLPQVNAIEPPEFWPFDLEDWKPKTPRQDLVRAAALIIAEIERIDRKAPPIGTLLIYPTQKEAAAAAMFFCPVLKARCDMPCVGSHCLRMDGQQP